MRAPEAFGGNWSAAAHQLHSLFAVVDIFLAQPVYSRIRQGPFGDVLVLPPDNVVDQRNKKMDCLVAAMSDATATRRPGRGNRP